MTFEGSNPAAKPQGENALKAYSNYFIGDDPTHWTSGVRSFKKLSYSALYPGINLDWYQSGGHLKYEYHLAAGADPAQIHELFEYAGDIILESGRLHIKTSLNDVWIDQPVAWHLSPSVMIPVACRFR